jgi:hypothetical protein
MLNPMEPAGDSRGVGLLFPVRPFDHRFGSGGGAQDFFDRPARAEVFDAPDPFAGDHIGRPPRNIGQAGRKIMHGIGSETGNQSVIIGRIAGGKIAADFVFHVVGGDRNHYKPSARMVWALAGSLPAFFQAS